MKKILNDVGFRSWADLFSSTIGLQIVTNPKIVAFAVVVSACLEYTIGLPFRVLIAFIVLNIIEFATGIYAAIHEGGFFESRKAFRAGIKTFIYLSILAVLNQFKSVEGGGELWWLFGWSYWMIVSMIALVLVRSIFENLHRLKVKEAMIVYQVLNNRYTRFLAYVASPPAPEKQQRNNALQTRDK